MITRESFKTYRIIPRLYIKTVIHEIAYSRQERWLDLPEKCLVDPYVFIVDQHFIALTCIVTQTPCILWIIKGSHITRNNPLIILCPKSGTKGITQSAVKCYIGTKCNGRS